MLMILYTDEYLKLDKLPTDVVCQFYTFAHLKCAW